MSNDPRPIFKITTNSMYGKLGNPSGAVGMTPQLAAKLVPRKARVLVTQQLEPDYRDRSIEEAVCIARDMLPEPTLLDLNHSRFPQASRAAEIIVRTVMSGAWFDAESELRLLTATPSSYVEAAVAVLKRLVVPNTEPYIAHETWYFVSALNVWALREDERYGINLQAPWRAPYPATETRIDPALFLGALAAWPSRLLEPLGSTRSLAEELSELDEALAALDRNSVSR